MNSYPYDITDPIAIERYARRLIDKSMRQVLGTPDGADSHKGGKGGFGQVLEKYYFGLAASSESAPDFSEAKVELKATPLVKRRKGLRAKERLVLNIINYCEIHKETFEHSSFLRKNAKLLVVAYLHDGDAKYLDLIIKLAGLWSIPSVDKKVIRDDWNHIVSMVRKGKAHELSEGQTQYLAACTKGADRRTKREQPFSDVLAMQRALSFKQQYVNSILRDIHNRPPLEEQEPIFRSLDEVGDNTFDKAVAMRLAPHIGQSAQTIAKNLHVTSQQGSKSYYSDVARAVLGVRGKKIEEFVKGEVTLRTLRVRPTDKVPYEDISFPAFKYEELLHTQWDDSDLLDSCSKRFYFVVFEGNKGGNYVLKGAFFWSMPVHVQEEHVRQVYMKAQKAIGAGKYDALPKMSEDSVCHVRPHGRNSADKIRTPQGGMQVKRCFWLNRSYIGSVIREHLAS